jgi:hypothetical protein
MSGIDIVTTSFGIGMTAILFSFSIILLRGFQAASIRGYAHNKKSAKTNEGKHSFFDFTL